MDLEESFRKIVRDELHGCIPDIVRQTANETLNQLQGHKRERNNLEERSKSLDRRQQQLLEEEEKLELERENLEQTPI